MKGKISKSQQSKVYVKKSFAEGIISRFKKSTCDEGLTFRQLVERIRDCKKCRLWKDAENAVPGEGPDNAKVMLVGQNPGEQENKTGKPFVGISGKFLDTILKKNTIQRDELFITNIVKHKTPNNRKPKADEIEECVPYLLEQIKHINPEIIVLMGKVAWQTPRKKTIEYIETYHPSAAMRFPKMRERFDEDFHRLKKLIKKRKKVITEK